MAKPVRGILMDSLTINRYSAVPIAQQIKAQIINLISSRKIVEGERLPSSRVLASFLQVARSTVVDAYYKLEIEGIISIRRGAGAFVNPPLSTTVSSYDGFADVSDYCPKFSGSIVSFKQNHRLRFDHRYGPFTTATPALSAFPLGQWLKISDAVWRQKRTDSLGYGSPYGYMPLREALIRHLALSRGLHIELDELFIVAGAQHAFHIIANLLLNTGDDVLFEDPGAIGARNVFGFYGANIVSVPVDRDGMCVEEGLKQSLNFRLAFVTPIHQQPLGYTMSGDRRQELLRAALRHDAWIVEDDYDGELCWDNHFIPPLKSEDVFDRVIYVGSFSKTLFPALRLGYLVVPKSISKEVMIALQAFHSMPPTHDQIVLTEFINAGHYAAHLRKMRDLYKDKFEFLLGLCEEYLAPWLAFNDSRIGLNAVGLVKGQWDEHFLAKIAYEHDILVRPIQSYALGRVAHRGVVLGFSGLTKDEMHHGVLTLRKIFDNYF